MERHSVWLHPMCCLSAPWPLSTLCHLSTLCCSSAPCPLSALWPSSPCPLVYSEMPCILSVLFIHLLPFTCTLHRVQGGFAAAPPARLKERQSAMGSCSSRTEKHYVPSPISGSAGTEALHMAKFGLLILISLLAVQLPAARSTWDSRSVCQCIQGQLRGKGQTPHCN